MREDMHEVIIERPRKSRGRAKSRRPAPGPIDLEDGGPSRGPVLHGGKRTKALNENLGPLKRFLSSRVGAHWDKVYSEISRNLRADNAVQQHVRDHLRDFVITETAMVDGEVWAKMGRRFFGKPERIKDGNWLFYVHPVSKVLMRNKRAGQYTARGKARRQAERAALLERRRDLAPDMQLHRLGGLWYEVRLEFRSPGAPRPYDVIRDAGLSKLEPQELYGGSWRRTPYGVFKRQLGKKELRKYGLESAIG